jgi:tungstate transport system substrate-binding protein
MNERSVEQGMNEVPECRRHDRHAVAAHGVRAALAGLLLAFGVAQAGAADTSITVASTTSTENSGLFAHILPQFQAESGIAVRVIAQGTGQALETGRRGDVDVVLVHARALEDRFVADGHGVERFDVMYNDFVLIGPNDDPAGVRGSADAPAAFAAIAAAGAPFASRGDNSGTHIAELALWAQAGVEPAGAWYRSTGSGMGATLNTAAQIPAYALSDRGTWLSFMNRADLAIVFEGDPQLFNPYGVMLVNPDRHPHVKAEAGQAFIDWLTSDAGRAAITGFTVGGEPLFFVATD